MPVLPPEWYTIKEAARLMGIGESALRKRQDKPETALRSTVVGAVEHVDAAQVEEARREKLEQLEAYDARPGAEGDAVAALRTEVERQRAVADNLALAVESLSAALRRERGL
ncbi:MAG TPA: hypothetical protein VGX28_02155 [Frankiaceae bacterium]|nr:hypothetical protein [Frankiaceae bacterium]